MADGGVRGEIAAVLATLVDVPVLPYIAEGMPVPSIVLYPAATYLKRSGQSFGDLVWGHTATVLAGAMDVAGVWDRMEGLILAIVRAPTLSDIGTTWESAGNYRLERVAGVDYVAADVTLTTTQTKES